jgi:hypothetical protein
MTYFSMATLRHTLRTVPHPQEVCIAVHETAHAVAAMAREGRVTELRMWRKAGNDWEGVCHWQPAKGQDALTTAATHAIVTIAPAAATASIGRCIVVEAPGWAGLSQEDTDLMARHHDVCREHFPEYAAFAAAMQKTAGAILREWGAEWERLTYALLQRGRLDEADIRGLGGELARGWERYEPKAAPEDVRRKLHELRAARGAYRVSGQNIEAGDVVYGLSYR